jgi:hypothetical protein
MRSIGDRSLRRVSPRGRVRGTPGCPRR